MSDWDRRGLLEDFYNLVIFTAIFSYYRIRNDYKGLAVLSKISFFFILITIITTNIALFFDPLLVRQTTSADFTPYQAQIYKITGAGGYGFMQALVLVIPILIYHIRFRKPLFFSRNIQILILILIIITQVRAQVFANILVAILITLLSFSSSKSWRRSIFPLTIVIVVLLIIPSSFYSDIFTKVSSYFDSESNIYFKLNDFSSFITDIEFDSPTDAGFRAQRYPLLFEAFLERPFLGDASYSSKFEIGAGGHLYWMNKLAIWGILGFTFFIYILYQIYMKIRILFDDSYRFYYFLSVLAYILLGLIKNIAGREPYLILIVVIPGLYFLPYINQNKVNKTIPRY
jgi:hypothetical protein